MDPERRAAHAVEFLEVAVHAICKERRVYEPSIYGSRRCFGVPVPHARHPDVATYVKESLDALKPLLEADAVDAVAVAVVDPRGEPLERFVFRFAPFPQRGGGPVDAEAIEATEYALRALLAKLSLLESRLPDAEGRDVEWRLLVETRADRGDAVGPYLADPRGSGYVDCGGAACARGFADPSVVPVRAVATPLAHFELYVECGGDG
mmetsp:Transcript_27882/g.83676  ORF Transcript_27882/g.83676 Transcript_27882/m.83676 type:complete len:207 (-) Transcript_27882:43-663(-)